MSSTDAQLLADKTDTLDNGLILGTTGFLATLCSEVEFHFNVEAIHIGIGFDN